MAEKNETAKLRLILDVNYTLNGTEVDVLMERLNMIATLAADNGMLRGEQPAKVDLWYSHVERIK